MCASGNQTISKQCYLEALSKAGRTSLGNKELRILIKAAGGCLISKK